MRRFLVYRIDRVSSSGSGQNEIQPSTPSIVSFNTDRHLLSSTDTELGRQARVAAVLKTNLATASALRLGGLDVRCSRGPSGAVNEMICGLFAVTPSAGWVDGDGAILVGLICSSIVWACWTYLARVRPFSKVDDAPGVVHSHGIAGPVGGLQLGLLADPGMVQYLGTGRETAVSLGLFLHPLASPALGEFQAAVWVIAWTGSLTAVLCTASSTSSRDCEDEGPFRSAISSFTAKSPLTSRSSRRCRRVRGGIWWRSAPFTRRARSDDL